VSNGFKQPLIQAVVAIRQLVFVCFQPFVISLKAVDDRLEVLILIEFHLVGRLADTRGQSRGQHESQTEFVVEFHKGLLNSMNVYVM
jgi:hypothetical protein